MTSRIGRSPETPRSSPLLGGDRWSIPLGVWGGAAMRMHASLAVWLVFLFAVCAQLGSAIGWLAAMTYLFSLAAREVAHATAVSSRRRFYLGSQRATVVLGPLGGMANPRTLAEPRDQVFIAMAGPLANLALVVLGMCCLANGGGGAPGQLLLNPELAIRSADSAATPLSTLAMVLIAVNWPLFLLNLAPAAPFDGGMALRALLGVWLDRDTAEEAARKIALLVAAGLLSVGFTLALVAVTSVVVPAAMASLAVVIAFGSRADNPVGFDPTPLGGRHDDVSGRSLADLPALQAAPMLRRHDEQPSQDQTIDQSEPAWDDGQVDRVLAKVHKRGVHELTANERAILERASQLYRRRRDEG